MAVRRKARSSTVTIQIDLETLQKLAEASAALSELATALVQASDDPRARAVKPSRRAKKGR